MRFPYTLPKTEHTNKRRRQKKTRKRREGMCVKTVLRISFSERGFCRGFSCEVSVGFFSEHGALLDLSENDRKSMEKSTAKSRQQERHIRKKKQHEISERPLESVVSLGHPTGVPARMPFSVIFYSDQQEFLGHCPVDTCFVPPGVPGTPSRCPAIFLKFSCPFLQQ